MSNPLTRGGFRTGTALVETPSGMKTGKAKRPRRSAYADKAIINALRNKESKPAEATLSLKERFE